MDRNALDNTYRYANVAAFRQDNDLHRFVVGIDSHDEAVDAELVYLSRETIRTAQVHVLLIQIRADFEEARKEYGEIAANDLRDDIITSALLIARATDIVAAMVRRRMMTPALS